ncbi:glycosyltransferase family 61 protein [Nocardioides sp. Kera G14]|uniref:glycosyltransferase family 61 protein n=1 Tax=Nocardioides sp. Kera G14 TaxID=2884264 RepID=UPI001D106341|nr:glycosyltransferase 61 family protein [Nocardioides sp. Kera G14]UDY23612.1 glycosyltransferase family 61 protein [Nocardioides sp. Kera G14]
MTLPTWLRRWWPLFKRLHRALTRLAGHAFRLLSPLYGGRGVPRSATARSVETAYLEPQSVTVHPGRAGVRVPRRPVSGEPADHELFASEIAASVPATFTLEITGGRLTGEFAAALTPGKILDLETSSYFGVWDWREHPVFLRPTLGEVEHISGTVLSLATRGTTQNYYHFLYDAIGRLGVLEESLGETRFDAVVVPHGTRYQRQLLDLVGLTERTDRLVQPLPGHTVSADRLLVPSNPNWALDAPPAIVSWLREHLRPSNPETGHCERLYLTRGQQPKTRRYVQEAELWPLLESRGFRMVDPGTLSVQEQIDLFSTAEAIVAPHGAALTNVTFSAPGVRVLELFASTYVHRGLWAICQAVGAEYRYVVADGPRGSGTGAYDDISIPPKRVLAALDTLLP